MNNISISEVSVGTRTTLAQAVFEAINRDFQRSEVQEAYREWKAQRNKDWRKKEGVINEQK